MEETITFKLLEETNHDGAIDCAGVFFRYSKSVFLSSHKSIEIRESFRILKKKSCPGCDKCQQLWEDFSMVDVEDAIVFPKKSKDGAMYEATFVSGGIDPDTGYLDDWWWELKEVEDE